MKRRIHGRNNEYTLEEKIKAVALMKDMGGLTKEAILACRILLPGCSKATLARWLRDYGDRVGSAAVEIVEQSPEASVAKMSMTNKMLTAYDNLLTKLADPEFVQSSTNLLHVATAIGILEERLRLAIGLSTEVINIVKHFIAVLNRKGLDPMDVFEDLILSYEEEPDVRSGNVIEIVADIGPQPNSRFKKGHRRQHGPGSR